MTFLIIFLISLIFPLLCTPYLITYLENIGIVDKPGKRRINTKNIPRMGGIIIFSCYSIVTTCFYNNIFEIRWILIASLIIVLCGIIDDIIGVKWFYKFTIQFVSAYLIFITFRDQFSYITLLSVQLKKPFDIIITIFFIVGILNSINLMDGLDGLVSGFSLVLFSLFFALSSLKYDYYLLVTLITLIGCLLGFLKYNSYPAKIFLGDTGSLFLGFYVVITSFRVSINYNSNVLDLTFPLILLAIPIVDTLNVMFKRILKKMNPFLPDKTHLHHVIMGNNIRHKITVFIILGLSLGFVLISLFYLKYKSAFSISLFVIGSIVIIYIQSFIKNIRKITVVHYLLKQIRNISHSTPKLIGNYLIYISILPIIIVIIKNFPILNNLSQKQIIILLVTLVIIYAISNIYYKSNDSLNSLYVYFNITSFFFINYSSHPFNNIFTEYYKYENILISTSLAILSIIEIYFMITRAVMQNKKDMFFNGIDFTIIVLTELMFIITNFTSNIQFITIRSNLIVGFIIYLVYKIIVFIKKDILNVIFNLSFVLPASALLFALFNK